MRGVESANRGTIFVKGDIANIVKAVFNPPMATIQEEYSGRVCLLRRQAGNSIDGFFCYFSCFQGNTCSADTEYLSDMRKIKVMVQIGTGPDLTYFDTSVTFIGCLVLRGEKRPDRGL